MAETGVGDKEGGGEGGENSGAAGDGAERRKKKRRKKKLISTLSFGEEIEEDGDGEEGDGTGEVLIRELRERQTQTGEWTLFWRSV